MPAACTLLRTSREFEAVTTEWEKLWKASSQAKPFQHPAWLLPWWRAFPQENLLAVSIRREGELVGLLPLYVYPNPVTAERQLLLIGAGTSDYLDGVFAPQCTGEDVREGIAQAGRAGGWDRASLAQLCPESPLFKALTGERSVEVSAGEPCGKRPAVAVAELPSKLRAEVRYHQNAARSLGRLRLEHASESNWAPVFEQLVGFHTERWKEVGQTGVLADTAVLAHHRAALPRLLAAGLARLSTLRAGEHTLGVLYSLVDVPERARRTQYFYLMGYAPKHERLRPGTLLLAQATEEAAQAGQSEIDMLRGDETYKKFWRLEPARTFSCSFGPETARALAKDQNGTSLHSRNMLRS